MLPSQASLSVCSIPPHRNASPSWRVSSSPPTPAAPASAGYAAPCSTGAARMAQPNSFSRLRAASSAAIALYAALGFTLTARRTRYYRDPDDDALLMRLPLQSNGGRIDD